MVERLETLDSEPPRSAADDGARLASLALTINLARTRQVAWTVALVLVALDIAASISAGEGGPYTLTRFFDGDVKVNFPTLYKLLTLLAAALLFGGLTVVARRKEEPFANGWRLLTFVAAFAFVDEATYLHQSIGMWVQARLDTHGFLTYAWTIVYFPAAAAVAAVLIRYLKYLDSAVARPMLIGGAIYMIGAIGFEPIKSKLSEPQGNGTLTFKLTACVSDSLEMIGLTMLVVVLLTELARRTRSVAFALQLGDG